MPQLTGYELGDILHQRPTSEVRRAVRQSDGKAVVVKMLTEEYPSEQTLAAFERGHRLACEVACDAVIPHLDLQPYGNGLAVVTEDFGASSLERLPTADLPLTDRLAIGVAVATALVEVHAHQIIHKDIKPHNVVRNPDTGVVKLIDFGIASQLTREHPSLKSPGRMEGTLAYVSPEQTGRMNRSIDSRSDLYSLGVTLYELFTGRLPFEAADPLALIHAHLARRPEPPAAVSGCPPALSELILTLLKKAPEERYQTAYGVQRDLERLLTRAQAGEALESVELRLDDVSRRFEIPQKLYGRRTEAAALLDAFGRASEGARELLLVAGYSGIGKSALVQEVYRPITEHRGWYCAGKFDQFRRDIPYAALTEALRDLTRQLLTEPGERIAQMKALLLAALGDNGRVILDVVPELEAVIGPQPVVPEVGSTEARHRFNNVFKAFVRVFARPEHPLTVFIDDLQWADVPSLKLLEVLVTDPTGGHLFVVGAYRDNEVYEGHALLETLDAIRDAGESVGTITLAPLDAATVTTLVADTLRAPADEATTVGELVHSKSGGNPFFVKELLNTLYRDGLIAFDGDRGRWSCDHDALRSVGITDNVVELVAGKLQGLAPATISVLQHAACLGGSFDLRTLAAACEQSVADTARALHAALADGFVLPTDVAYKYMEAVGAEGEVNAHYRFVHDRVHQAAYSLLTEDERRRIHLHTGELLWAQEDRRDAVLMDVANHFEMARDLLTTAELRDRAAGVLLAAGTRAMASMAFGPAANYLGAALALLPSDAWSSDYGRALALHTRAAEAEFLNSRYESMESLIDVVVGHAAGWLDEANVQAIRIKALIAQGRHAEALDLAFDMLDRVDVVLPRQPTPEDIGAGFGMARAAVGDRTMQQLLELPPCDDPERILAMELLMSAAPSAYFSRPNAFPVINFHLVKLSVEAGFSVPSIYGYVVFGMMNSGIFGDPTSGYAFGRLAWDLLDRYDTRSQIGRAAMIWGTFVGHWTDHAVDGAKIMYDKFRAAEEVGDLEHATYSVLQAQMIEVLVGRPLAVLKERYAEPAQWVIQAKQQVGIALVAPYYQAVLDLLNPAHTTPTMSGDWFDWEAGVQQGYDSGFTMLVAYSSVGMAHTAIVFGDWALAEQALDHAEATADQLVAHYGLSCINFYRSLCLARRAAAADGDARDELLSKLDAAQTQLDAWAQAAPINHRHKHALVAAERARAVGDGMEALRQYAAAISGARAGGFINEEAIAYELLAEHCAESGLQETAEFHRRRARALYVRWGAAGKVAALDAEHGEPVAQTAHRTTSTTETMAGGDGLDLETFMRASRSISGQIDLERLLDQVMALVIENAGADRGALLLLDEAGELRVEALRGVDGATELLRSTPLADAALPVSLLQYCRRTGTSVVLHDAPTSELFGKDPYIAQSGPKSVLAAPISNAGKLTGLVFLENRLSTEVFTASRVGVVEMLCAQAAVSIANSRLFAEQKLQAESFARFVPQQFLQHLGRRRITDVQLGDSSTRDISVMFSDLRNFTSISGSSTGTWRRCSRPSPSTTASSTSSSATRSWRCFRGTRPWASGPAWRCTAAWNWSTRGRIGRGSHRCAWASGCTGDHWCWAPWARPSAWRRRSLATR